MVPIVGKSRVLQELLQMTDRVAPTNATILIQGESGTGKELIAHRLHHQSQVALKAFVSVNCAALSENLLESELFGHEKGSFTGAVNQKIGLCETADGGTLFLDEIGEISPALQTKLLRFLQEGEFYRIGGNKPIQVTVRIVSATNRNLENEVKAGRFREDLFYRLNAITLRTPSLRERKDDLPLLIEHFLKHTRVIASGSVATQIAPEVIDVFKRYEWPGNIRELQNTLERLSILSKAPMVEVDDVPYEIRFPVKKLSSNSSHDDNPALLPLEEVEKRHILKALAFFSGNKSRAAESLGITAKTLYNKLLRYGAVAQEEEMAS